MSYPFSIRRHQSSHSLLLASTLCSSALALILMAGGCSSPLSSGQQVSSSPPQVTVQTAAPSAPNALTDQDKSPTEANDLALATERRELEKEKAQQQIANVVNAPMAAPVAARAAPIAVGKISDSVAKHTLAVDEIKGEAMARIAAPPPPSLTTSAPLSSIAYAPPQAEDRERYDHIESNPVQRVAENPVSTFSIDVDTGAYANVRRFLNEGQLPPKDAVRVEELVNYFDYAYAPPKDRSTPFATHTEIAQTPWNSNTLLLKVGIQGWQPQADNREMPPSNLVFLVDVSGSMNEPNKLPLLKSSLKLLTRHMTHQDRISLVVYAGNTGVVLEPTPGDDTATVETALDHLEAGGSTNGAGGIQLAYQMAQKAFIPNGDNRVLLATDGDFNVGISDTQKLKSMIEDKRRSGIALSTLGFGTGNYNDAMMEQLADVGNGNYTYVDSLKEAQKALVDEREATLLTIAKDVKIQVEFNPAAVAEYRLIGYEDRMLKREDFNNDKIDAGDIGAGHRVTALYEIALVGSGGERVEPLRYAAHEDDKPASTAKQAAKELAFLRLRYKRPEDGMDASSKLIEQPILRSQIEAAEQITPSFKLAAAVAAYGQLLRGGSYLNPPAAPNTRGDRRDFDYANVVSLAQAGRGADPHGYAGEFIQLAQLAGNLQTRTAHAAGLAPEPMTAAIAESHPR